MSENLNELIPFQLISNGGDASSLFYQALNEAQKGNFVAADEFVKKGDEALLMAHKLQTDLIFSEANGNKIELSILMVHAQDHLMNAMLLKDLVNYMIRIFKELKERNSNNENI